MHEDRVHSPGSTNVGVTERWVGGLGGGLLIAYGLARPSWPRWLAVGSGACLVYRSLRGHCELYGLLGVDTADRSASATTFAVVTINRPAAEIYGYLKNPERIRGALGAVTEVNRTGVSSFTVEEGAHGKAPARWQVEVTAERANEFVAWHVTSEGKPGHAGQLTLRNAPGNQGTEVEVQLQQEGVASPAGILADKAAGLGWRTKVTRALQRLKQLVEAGETADTAGQSAGVRSVLGRVLSPDR
ncbi:MAG TPA: SRPBCC family protein [Chthoniobacterales bacterium]